MKVLVFGGGAVGLGLAAPLVRSGATVAIVARPGTVDALRRGGLVQSGLFGDHGIDPATFAVGPDVRAVGTDPVDHVLVCTKSTDSPAVSTALAAEPRLFGPRTRIVLCQNGWGNAEVFADVFPRERIRNARIITGFEQPKPNHVNVTVHAQPVHVGSVFHAGDPDVSDLCDALTRGGLPTVPSRTLVQDLWAKMYYSCALNPLSAILRVSYGELAASPHARATMDRILAEVFAVQSAAGFAGHFASADEYRQLFYGQLVVLTAAHRSSMLQDIEAGRPTEIEALNGTVVRLGDAHGVPTPSNRAVCDLIRFLDAQPTRSAHR